MGYLNIETVYKKNKELKELEGFLSRVNNPKFEQSLKRIKYQGTTIAKESGLYNLVNGKYSSCKSFFFLAAENELHRYNNYGNTGLLYAYTGIVSLIVGLLSDNEVLILKLSNAGKDLDIPRRNKGSLNLLLQCAMRDDESALREAMATYAKYQLKKEWNELQLAFYVAYLDRDEEKVKEVLTQLETPKLKRQSIFNGEFIDDYLSVLTTAYLKLCWRKGMEIHIDSKTVPMEMMPIAPLEEYKIEYPYLEGWENDDVPVTPAKDENRYEEVGPYPNSNPSLRSKFVSMDMTVKAVDHFCTRHSEEEKAALSALIWEAYTDPEHFDLNHKEYLIKNNVCWPLDNADGERVLEARPFWSELTEYDDEGFFFYCNHFIIMNEMDVHPDEVDAYLEELKGEIDKGGGFFTKWFG